MKKNSLLILIIIILIVVIGKLFISIKELEAIDIRRCSQFGNRANAQAAFNSNPKAYAWADRDHDGKACEMLPIIINIKP